MTRKKDERHRRQIPERALRQAAHVANGESNPHHESCLSRNFEGDKVSSRLTKRHFGALTFQNTLLVILHLEYPLLKVDNVDPPGAN